MTIVVTPTTHLDTPTPKVEGKFISSQSLAERLLTIMAMGGAVCGAIAGSALGAALGSEHACTCGTLGTMLGSGLAAGASQLILPVWVRIFTGAEDCPKPQPTEDAGG